MTHHRAASCAHRIPCLFAAFATSASSPWTTRCSTHRSKPSRGTTPRSSASTRARARYPGNRFHARRRDTVRAVRRRCAPISSQRTRRRASRACACTRRTRDGDDGTAAYTAVGYENATVEPIVGRMDTPRVRARRPSAQII